MTTATYTDNKTEAPVYGYPSGAKLEYCVRYFMRSANGYNLETHDEAFGSDAERTVFLAALRLTSTAAFKTASCFEREAR